MASPSAASSASSGINSPGGSINENSPSAIVVAIIVVGLIVLYFIRRKK